jgi:hypothetical protein
VRATARCLVIAITIVSWIAISNHCAIRAVATKAETAQSGCPFHSKPAKPQQPIGTECCKILRAIPTTPANNLAPVIIDLFPVDQPLHHLAILEPLQISVAPSGLDTGPPGKTSFVELNRSLRAHAPPFVA